MRITQAIALGIVQGLTEFLPVSSSGHLTLFQMGFGMSDTGEMIALDVALHAATLLAVLVYFGRRWITRVVAEPRIILPVIIACVPAIVLYLAGGGMVKAVVRGTGDLVSVEFDPSILDPDDPEMAGDLVVAAVNAALKMASDDAGQAMGGLAGGLDLGGLLG